jgi:hypothetical protein
MRRDAGENAIFINRLSALFARSKVSLASIFNGADCAQYC